MTDLSIIIVCFKGWDRLIKCLDSLNTYTGETYKCEVIVVDNNSGEDRIFEIEKRFPRFRFIHNPVNGGFAHGCNLGAKNAIGEFFLFLNPDTIATETEVEKLIIAARQNPSFSILSCNQFNEKGKKCNVTGPFPRLFNLTGFQRALFSRRQAEGDRHMGDFSFPDWISGSVVLIREELFNKINGFDEDFWMYFEDVDICRRVRNLGGEIALCGNIFIEHNHGGSSRINIKTASLTKTEVNISRHLYISKHKVGFEKLTIQVFLIVNNLISGGLMALSGLLLFFIPKIFARTMIFIKLLSYYFGALSRLSWISPRSVNFQ
jgi:GT2 family glycosyltransferase